MKNIYYLAIFAIIFAASSCSSSDNDIAKLEYEINNDSDNLTNTRIEYYGDEEIYLTQPGESQESSELKSSLKKKSNLSLYAGLKSPVRDGDTLSASYLTHKSGYIYVTYNIQGAEYGGALSIFDVNNKNKIRLIEEVIFPNMDINTALISKNNKTLWLGGSNASGSTIITVALKGSGLIDNSKQIESNNINRGASTNGIAEHKDLLFVSVGNTNGGNFALDVKDNYSIIQSFPFRNSKSVVFQNPNKFIALEGGDNANIKLYKEDKGIVELEETFPLGSPIYHRTVPEEYKYFGKNTVFITEGLKECYVAMGANGAKVISIENGDIIASSPSNMLTNGNTNGIWFDQQYIYLANGANGVAFANKLKKNDTELDIVGIWDEPKYPGSANFVCSHANYVYVAKGKTGGLKILEIK